MIVLRIDFNFFDYLVYEVIHKGAVSTTFFKIIGFFIGIITKKLCRRNRLNLMSPDEHCKKH